MISNFFSSWTGGLSKQELKKFLFLAMIFVFTVGVYWFLRTSKDGVFNTIVGFEWQPFAKWVSMFFVIPLTMFYGILVDTFPRHRVFYALSVLYATGSLIFAYLLNHPEMGLSNHQPDALRYLGWAYYLFVESFGSIMVVLFWSFAADTTTPENAKRGFPMLSFFAQFGALFGSAINAGYFGTFKIQSTLYGCFIAILMIAVMIFVFMTVIPQEQLKSYSNEEKPKKESKSKVGFLEGFKLVMSQPYLLGIFFSIMIFEIIATLFDFKFKALVGDHVATLTANVDPATAGILKTQMFNEWVGWMGVWTAILAIGSYILGIGNIGRKLGLTTSLIILPVLLGGVALILGSLKSVTIAAIAVVIAKGINYALYQPTKEQLYIPTSKDAKYKSKAFIEMFGSRTSKAVGSLVNMIKLYAPVIFPIISMGSSLGLCLIWLMISMYLGKTYDKAVSKNEIVC